MKILKLTIKKQWFDRILKGEKIEEYREIKPYWLSRLVKSESIYPRFKKYNLIEFTNGYGKDKPSATFECRGVEIGQGKSKWGATGEDVFIIKLGNEVSRYNCQCKY